jgi:hypothetical protein
MYSLMQEGIDMTRKLKAVQILMTAEQHQQIREGAARAGQPMATWMRSLALAAATKNQHPQAPEMGKEEQQQ